MCGASLGGPLVRPSALRKTKFSPAGTKFPLLGNKVPALPKQPNLVLGWLTSFKLLSAKPYFIVKPRGNFVPAFATT